MTPFSSATTDNVTCVSSALARYELDRLAGLSPDRRRVSLRVLCELESVLGGDASRIDAARVGRLLDARAAAGRSVATVRKERSIVLAFSGWCYREGVVDAGTLLALRALRVPGRSVRGVEPLPYAPSELRELRATLDSRWPLLPADEAERWLSRFREGRSPYSRVRSHVVRCQLDAIVSLALYIGLRRWEIRALTYHGGHSDNDQLVVVREDTGEVVRTVPYTAHPRTAMWRWEHCRYALGADTREMWLSVHAAPRVRQPLKPDRFNNLLATYIGPGWTLKRLRDTCAVTWVRAGLPLERLREMLGLARIDGVSAYAQPMRGTLDDEIGNVERRFDKLIGPVVFNPTAA